MHYKSKRSTPRLPKIVLVVCIVLSILFVFGLSRELVNRHEISKQVKALDKEIADLQDQNKELSDMYDSLQGDAFIEKEARLRLGLQKPGEKVAVIKRSGEEGAALALSDGAKVSGSIVMDNNNNITPNPIKWWHYFFK